jgi:hypothetical protein
LDLCACPAPPGLLVMLDLILLVIGIGRAALAVHLFLLFLVFLPLELLPMKWLGFGL